MLRIIGNDQEDKGQGIVYVRVMSFELAVSGQLGGLCPCPSQCLGLPVGLAPESLAPMDPGIRSSGTLQGTAGQVTIQGKERGATYRGTFRVIAARKENKQKTPEQQPAALSPLSR